MVKIISRVMILLPGRNRLERAYAAPNDTTRVSVVPASVRTMVLR